MIFTENSKISPYSFNSQITKKFKLSTKKLKKIRN